MIRNWLDEEFGLYEINNLEIIGEEDKNKKNMSIFLKKI